MRLGQRVPAPYRDAAEQIVQRLAALQGAKAGRVGRGDVEHEIVGQSPEPLQPDCIVASAVFGSLFAPIFAPTTPPRGRRRASRAATASRPSLLKPMRLITAPSAVRRKRRGRGFPACGRGVTLPHSTKPKPAASMASGTSAFLSKPAARPTQALKLRPQSSTARFAGAGPSRTRGPSPARNRPMVSRWASSASRAGARPARPGHAARSSLEPRPHAPPASGALGAMKRSNSNRPSACS